MTCNDQQVRKLMELSQTHTQEKAALKVGVDRKTSRKYLRASKLPSEIKKNRSWKTRKDIFENVWPEIEIKLKESPKLQAKILLEWLIEQQKEPFNFIFQDCHLRTLQRKIRIWKAEFGPDKEIIFSQILLPGKQSQSDCTCMNDLKITLKGEYFKHLLFHFMLPYSRWETVSICFSESFDSLTLGFKKATRELGGVLPDHRTDNLTAATHAFRNEITGKKERDFNEAWLTFLSHYSVKPSRNNPGVSHENGSVEKSHDIFKTAIDQELMLRRSRDFYDVEEYEKFLRQILGKKNKGRQTKFIE